MNQPIDSVDILVAINDSGAMRDNGTQLMVASSRLVTHLLAHGITSVRVGVVSMDLGTGGVAGTSCGLVGDDGRLNPVRYGPSLSTVDLNNYAPAGYGRPADCGDFPSFLSFSSESQSSVAHDLACNTGLWVRGCSFQQSLEAVQRALVTNDARDLPANTSINAGFIREEALLAILVVTDKGDESARDCTRSDGADCVSSTDVFDTAASGWSSDNLRLRFYLFRDGTSEDPTWPLERYVNPAQPADGWMRLKPNHPERMIFGALVGVPLSGWTLPSGDTDWDALLGTPVGGADDFLARDSTSAIHGDSAEGPISMVQAELDPRCNSRVIPACRRAGSPYVDTCSPDLQYYAWPARRVVEIARRFDASRLCHGNPCGNGIVASICEVDFSDFMIRFAERIESRR